MRNEGKSVGVYSTGIGRICPGCARAHEQCSCRDGKSAPAGDGIVRVGRETKGRSGKGVTLISGVALAGDGLRELAAELKRACGTGGTVKEGVIEIQGDHRDRLLTELQRRGYRVKRAGGGSDRAGAR